MAERVLSLYGVYAFTQEFWGLNPDARRELKVRLADSMDKASEACHLYSLFPQRSDADYLVWSAWDADDPSSAEKALRGFSQAMEEFRTFTKLTLSLWGFTRPSTYSRGKSEQDMDPFEGHRTSYLVIYPFSKTKEWYLMSMDARQGMMNEHIKIGKQYFDVKQLLLYSFGLQDHEFVVSYEVEDLARFSDLVYALRDTEGRRYTLLDAPIVTGVHCTREEFAG